MKIYIAKHYWKDNKNATWECHPKLNKKLFEYFKENYHNFVKDRNSKIEKDGYFIYLCYVDAKDDYKRDITNITFFVSQSEVKINLCDKEYKNLEYSRGFLKDLPLRKIILSIGVVFFLIIGYLGLTKLYTIFKTKESSLKKEKVSFYQDYRTFRTNWNEKIDENKTLIDKFKLDENNSRLIEQLNDFIKPFPVDNNNSKVVFTNTMSKDEIKNTLKEITGGKDTPEIVMIIVEKNKYYH